MRDAQLFAEDGGPIIMVQIENEYGNIEAAYGDEGAKYVAEVANYALDKNLDVPWVMCQQGEGVGTAPPGEIINTCNGHYCDNWISQVFPSLSLPPSPLDPSHLISPSTPQTSLTSLTCGPRTGLDGFRSG